MKKIKWLAAIACAIAVIVGSSFPAGARGSGAHFSSPKAGYKTGTYAAHESMAPKAAAPKTTIPKSNIPKTAVPKTTAPKTAQPKSNAPKPSVSSEPKASVPQQNHASGSTPSTSSQNHSAYTRANVIQADCSWIAIYLWTTFYAQTYHDAAAGAYISMPLLWKIIYGAVFSIAAVLIVAVIVWVIQSKKKK